MTSKFPMIKALRHSFRSMFNKNLFGIIFVFSIFTASCDKLPSEVIEAESANFTVISINLPDTFNYNPASPKVPISIEISRKSLVNGIYFDVFSADKKNAFLEDEKMYDDGNTDHGDNSAGDNIYSAKFELGTSVPSAKYLIQFTAKYILFGQEEETILSKSYFYYNTGAANASPVISNVQMPDSVNVETPFVFSVDVADSNGLADIKRVYYKLFRPDGSQVVNSGGDKEFPMYDNGDTNGTGDQTSGDGRFSFKLSFPDSNPPQPKGDWNFKFGAEDNSGALSNEISKSIKLL